MEILGAVEVEQWAFLYPWEFDRLELWWRAELTSNLPLAVGLRELVQPLRGETMPHERA